MNSTVILSIAVLVIETALTAIRLVKKQKSKKERRKYSLNQQPLYGDIA